MSRLFKLCILLFVSMFMGASCYSLDQTEVYTAKSKARDDNGKWIEICDTVGIIRYDVPPRYLGNTVLSVAFMPIGHLPDSVMLCLNGVAGASRFKQHSYTWYGSFDRGDTLTCTFEFAPLRVGSMSFNLDIFCGGRFCYNFHYGFTLDERGVLVPDIEPKQPAVAVLGPSRDLFGDTLFEAVGSYPLGPRNVNTMHILAKLYPVPMNGTASILEYSIVPNEDINHGVFWKLSSNDIFEIAPLYAEEWPAEVRKGDTLRVSFNVQPIRSGVGHIVINVTGYPEPLDLSEHARERISERMNLYLPFDDALNLLAITQEEVGTKYEGFRQLVVHPSEQQRLSAIKALEIRQNVVTIASPSYEVKKKEETDLIFESRK